MNPNINTIANIVTAVCAVLITIKLYQLGAVPGAVEWSSLTHAGAFLAGAFLATVAVLRVMRAVGSYLGALDRRRRDRPPPGDDE